MVHGRRLRSNTVVLGGVGLLAAALVSCSSDPAKRCADPSTHRTLDDAQCQDGGPGRYYYGGSVHGGRLSGGSFDKSTVERGGFGHGSSGDDGAGG
jgi:hypothetical protein